MHFRTGLLKIIAFVMHVTVSYGTIREWSFLLKGDILRPFH